MKDNAESKSFSGQMIIQFHRHMNATLEIKLKINKTNFSPRNVYTYLLLTTKKLIKPYEVTITMIKNDHQRESKKKFYKHKTESVQLDFEYMEINFMSHFNSRYFHCSFKTKKIHFLSLVSV